MSESIPPDAPRPRLCHLKKWSDFNGYGFNLHAERGKAGQFVGTIDPGSPSETAHLRAGDRIVEVNGTNIGSENHQQVVQRIKAVASETRLLVVDAEADDYYHDRKIVIRGDMPNVEYHVTPDYNPLTHPKSDASGSAYSSKITTEPDYSKYHARRCQLRIWPDFSGYGFNLHADRAGMGQFIGKVDDGSPAEASGLREHDRIVEVNGVNVAGKTHAEVVAEVKSRQGEVEMLVVDHAADEHFNEHGVTINGSMPGVRTVTCPIRSVNGGMVTVDKNSNEDLTDNRFQERFHRHDENQDDDDDEDDEQRGYVHKGYRDDDEDQDRDENYQHNVAFKSQIPQTTYEIKPSAGSVPPAQSSYTVHGSSASASIATSAESSTRSSASVSTGGIEFAGSAKEARERMKGKRNVKSEQNMSLKEKYDLLQKL